MVHGNYYGIQYEIHLTKELDYYDDLLPIWIDLRTQIQPEKDRHTGNYKLIVIHYNDFSPQLNRNSLFHCYIRENDQYKYNRQMDICEEDYLRSNQFVMVKLYEKTIKHLTSLPEPITKEEFDRLVAEKHQLDNISLSGRNLSQEEWKEHDKKVNEISKQLKIQMFIYDPEYFQEIINLKKKLLDQVTFSEEQNERIKKIITHPKLEGIISWHGLTLVDGFW